MELFKLRFEYNEKYYTALVNEKRNNGLQYRVTIMNGELEKMLYGNNILVCKDGKLSGEPSKKIDPAIASLQNTIANELEQYLRNRQCYPQGSYNEISRYLV